MTKTVTQLITDYQVVGAGAMGMSFIEELITSSSGIEAIMIDTRALLWDIGMMLNHLFGYTNLHRLMESTPGLLELVVQTWHLKFRSCNILSSL